MLETRSFRGFQSRSQGFFAFVGVFSTVSMTTLLSLNSIGFVPYFVDGTPRSQAQLVRTAPTSATATDEFTVAIPTHAVPVVSSVDVRKEILRMNSSVPKLSLPSLSIGSLPALPTMPKFDLIEKLTSFAGMFVIEKKEEQVVEKTLALNTIPQLSPEEGVVVLEYPERLIIPDLDLDIAVANPISKSPEALDDELTRATVRYPGSALLGGEGNVVIFGHSSHLPVVRNKLYKIFNGLPELKEGSIIKIVGKEKEYMYSVVSVRKTDANDEIINLATTEARLTLATCDTFGKKSSRFVVDAKLIGSYIK
jgi:LPXTG-site transpeptidase (sortase) family protein